MTLGEAARRALLVRTAEAGLYVDPARRRSDPEGVHDLRVAVRRLRAVLDGFRAALGGKAAARRLDVRLRALMRAAGAVRDLDIVRARLRRAARRAPAKARDQIQRIAERFEAGRAAAEAGLDRALQTFVMRDLPRVASAVAGAAGKKAARKAVAARLDRRAERMGARARAAPSLTPEDLHALRIATKKMRDLTEATVGLFPENAPRLAALRRLATELGDLHDVDVWVARMEAARRDAAVQGGAAFLLAMAKEERTRRAERLARRLAAGQVEELAGAVATG